MSLESWKAEFYPVKASEVSKEDALDHSIKKWTGLLPENLAKHGLSKRPDSKQIAEGTLDALCDTTTRMNMSSDNCALCFHHLENSCRECPLAHHSKANNCRVPWYAWTIDGNPVPMLQALKATKEKYGKKQPILKFQLFSVNSQAQPAARFVDNIKSVEETTKKFANGEYPHVPGHVYLIVDSSHPLYDPTKE